MPKVMIVLDVAEQPRVRELVAMWAYGLAGADHEVFHPMNKDRGDGSGTLVATISILDFISAEVVEEPPAQHRLTKRDMQERLSISGGRDE